MYGVDLEYISYYGVLENDLYLRQLPVSNAPVRVLCRLAASQSSQLAV